MYKLSLIPSQVIKFWAIGQYIARSKGVRKGVGGVGAETPPLRLIFYENFITCAKEIKCFRILFVC